jgi:hypothetical protein
MIKNIYICLQDDEEDVLVLGKCVLCTEICLMEGFGLISIRSGTSLFLTSKYMNILFTYSHSRLDKYNKLN